MAGGREYELGALEKVDLRKVWPHEALDFTKWLAEEESLALLSDAVGIEARPFDASKASGVRLWKEGCKIEGNEGAWPEFLREQLGWALKMRNIVAELGL